MAIIRKNSRDLTPAEQQTYKTAIEGLINNGEYARFVNMHAPTMSSGNLKIHGMSGSEGLWRFLAWHRMYLIEFEKVLKVPLPYWKWTEAVPDWVDNFAPTKISGIVKRGQPNTTNATPKQDVNIVTERVNVGKNMKLYNKPAIDRVLGMTKFIDFTRALEALHDGAHAARQGVMNSNISPSDPIFWLLHSNVDRIWDEWQRKPGNMKRVPRMPSSAAARWSNIIIGAKIYTIKDAGNPIQHYNIKYV